MIPKFRKLIGMTAAVSVFCALTLPNLPEFMHFSSIMAAVDQTASEGTCGENLYWKVIGDTLTISGTGNMDNYLYCDTPSADECAPWYYYIKSDSIKNIILEEGVTSIGFRAFANMKKLTSVSFPSTMQAIGFAAFDGCTALKEIEIKSGWIGESAFINCTALEKVTIGGNVTDMGISAFENCISLQSVWIEDLAAWCRIRFGGIHANPLEYAGHLYLNQAELKDLVIPEGISEIQDFAFIHARLNSVGIPAGVTKIGEYAFSLCTEIQRVSLPEGLSRIEARAFEGNISLTEIRIPDSVSYIGYRAFCAAAIPEADVAQGKICDYAFEGCGLMTSAVIGEQVTHIGAYAFHGCAALGNAVYYGSELQWNQMEIGIENSPFSSQVQFLGTGTESASHRVTERLIMGLYQDEPLKWRVLYAEDSRKLVITEKAIAFMRMYPVDMRSNQWAGSAVRQWLNHDFYDSVFTEEEKIKIQRTAVSTQDNELYLTSGGTVTKDDLFLLSAEEVMQYFPDEEARMTEASAAALAEQSDPGILNSETCYWWLRSTGMFSYSCMFVDYNGYIRRDGAAAANYIFAVRPAMWIDTSASEKLELGNLNDDDAVNAQDAAAVLEASASRGTGSPSGLNALQEEAADVNADGSCNSIDAALILQYSSEFGTGKFKGSFTDFLNERVFKIL